MSDPRYLALDKLTLAYGGSVAVQDLSLTVKQGELIALLGPSGCGKTTTMRAIAGLMPVAGGTVTLAGRDLTHLAPNKRGIGLVFQSYALFPHLSVEDNVAFGLKLKGVPAAERAQRVKNALARVDLAHLADRLPKALSGGQQQRVALARSIVVEPGLLLLDEPLSNLDARLRLEMRSELARLQRELGITMIYVTHDQAEALALADRIVVMRAGKIEQQGSPEEIYERPVSSFVARFMGFENCFALEEHKLIGAGGMLPAPAGASSAGLAWRPRGVVLGRGPHQGEVLGASYQGQSVEYLLKSAIGPIKAEADSSAPRHAVGTQIAFDLPLSTAAPLTSVD
jgi:putative spermidine/putrescine transport system ATP-binding protein